MRSRFFKPTILIVDDQPVNVDVLSELLKPAYRVKVALSGAQALNLVTLDPPDLILLDIMMPEMDGYEVCRQLKQNPLTAPIPVIFVTALTDVIDENRGFELGAVDYITKPISPSILQARVRTHLALYDQSRHLEELVRLRTEALEQANLRLKQERAMFEWVVQAAPDGYVILDTNGYLLFANPQARLYLGLPSENRPISETFLELARRQYHLETEEAWDDFLTQPQEQPRYLIRPETGSSPAFWLAVDLLEMADRKRNYWVVRLRDVTYQINTWRNWETFTGMVSHKLRTPLDLSTTSLEILSRQNGELSPAEVAEIAQTVLRSIKRLNQSIQAVLSYLDLPGSIEMEAGFLLAELPAVASEIAANLHIPELKIHLEPALLDERMMLPQQAVELILWELLENSHKFHPQNAPKVEINISKAEDRRIQLQLQDNGTSLSPEQLSKLWLPYYQGERWFTGELPGMGLGLARVATLVWSSGGRCHAYNRPDGPGLVVELQIPLQETAPLDHWIFQPSDNGSEPAKEEIRP